MPRAHLDDLIDIARAHGCRVRLDSNFSPDPCIAVVVRYGGDIIETGNNLHDCLTRAIDRLLTDTVNTTPQRENPTSTSTRLHSPT